MARGQTPALTPEQAERYREVIRLRTVGLKFHEIAERVGYASRSGAKEAYDAALRWWGREAVDDLRTIEGERTEELWRYTFARIIANPESTAEFVSLVNSAVKVSQRRAALYGLDAPRQVEISGEDGGPVRTDVGEILLERIRALAVERGVELPELPEA
jgi:hypothetical protein